MRPTDSNRYDTIVEVQKFNPYHDRLGRFSTSSGAASFTYKPGKSKAHDLAIQRAQRKQGSGTGAKKQTQGDPTAKWRPEWMPEIHRRNKSSQDRHPVGVHQGVEAVMAQTGASDAEAQAMYDAVYNFSKWDSTDIRKYAYDGPPPSSHKADAENIEKFISASPQWDDGPLYRGMDVKPDVAMKILAEAKAGKPLGQRGPASWSSDRSTAEGFASKSAPGNISIIFCTGGKQNGTSIKHLSDFPREEEVLMSNDARWRATADPVEISPGVWEIVCEAIDVP